MQREQPARPQRPYVWQMIREALESLGVRASNKQIRECIHERYGDVNDRTINAHLISCCVNQPSRVHYPRNKRPRIASRAWDLLFRTERGWVERYDPLRHGVWEIRQSSSGRLMVARRGESAPSPDPGGAGVSKENSLGRGEDSCAFRGGFAQSRRRWEIPMPTVQELKAAAAVFAENESRQRYYDLATEHVASALNAGDVRALREALWILLSTWNAQYYRFHPPTAEHFSAIDDLVQRTWSAFVALRNRSLEDLGGQDLATMEGLFREFNGVLGPVGAAKSLHLLAPRVFPIWDRKIAKAYNLHLQGGEKNVREYCRFIKITQRQIRHFGGERALGRNPVKGLDEFNYCRFTKHWETATANAAA